MLAAHAGLSVRFAGEFHRGLDGRKLKISREIEGGNKEINEIDLPCVLSIQTGINEPRYVGMRGIRQVASVPIPTLARRTWASSPRRVGEAAAKVKRLDYFVPAAGQGRRDAAGQPRRDRRQADRVGESQRRVELMPRIFAYIVHKGGCRRRLRRGTCWRPRERSIPAQSPTAIVTGWGADLDAVCETLRAVLSAKSGRSPTSRSRIPTPNWSARRW